MARRPSRIVTLATDYGTRDPYAAIVRGVIASIAPEAVIVDVTHEIEPYDVAGAAYMLRSYYGEFPQGTIHVVVVDPGVGSARRPLAVKTRNYYFIGPDNGVLLPAAERDGIEAVVQLDNDKYHRKPVSATFHGRDIFAPAAAYLALGVPLQGLGSPVPARDLVRPPVEFICERHGKGVMTRVVHVDRFGNLITGCLWDEIENIHGIPLGSRIIIVARAGESYRSIYKESFSLARPGEIVMYRGSLGFAEIGIYVGSMSKATGVKRGDKIYIEVVD